LQCCYVKYCKR